MTISRILLGLMICFQLLNSVDARPFKDMTVHHYARHHLCQNKKDFYDSLLEKFRSMRTKFAEYWVFELCERRNEILDKWVSELFDLNSDGDVDFHEQEEIRKRIQKMNAE
ncbi:hypothetical protein ACF0H5_023757 [Mactra antiquata]